MGFHRWQSSVSADGNCEVLLETLLSELQVVLYAFVCTCRHACVVMYEFLRLEMGECLVGPICRECALHAQDQVVFIVMAKLLAEAKKPYSQLYLRI